MKARKSPSPKASNPHHDKQLARLRRVKGQLEAIERMISERQYCPDILIQLRASSSALKSLEGAILEVHLNHCVRDAFESSDESNKRRKIDEIIRLFAKS